MLDLRITGGTVHDGTGAPARVCDVGIAAGRIADLGDLSTAEARRTIDAAGRLVCPGFIDVHSHSDTYLLIEPAAPSKVWQGVTTEVVGNCGASAAPLVGRYHMPSDWKDKTYPCRWSTVAEYRVALEQARPAVNVYALVGHNTLRSGVMGHEARAATPDERGQMERLLERALGEGARGLSTGLIYSPGMFAPADEIAGLAAVTARCGGIYTSHMRSEGGKLLEAIDETIGYGRATGGRVEISHLKTSGQANWGLRDQALERIRRARAEGLPVAADRYPYTAACTDLDVLLPDWAAAGGRDAILGRLRDRDARRSIRDELVVARSASYWKTVVVGSTRRTEFRGRPLVEVAAQLGLEPVDAALELIESDDLKTSAFFFGMSEENMWAILAEPYVMIGSDASLRATSGPLSEDYPHPRAYGAFPRFLRAALDGRTVPVTEAIRKMTSLPADHFGMAGRGRIAVGACADVLVLNPVEIAEESTFGDPHRYARGVESMVVNGCLTIDGQRLTGDRAGRMI